PCRQDAELWRADGGDEHLAGCRISQARFGRAGRTGRQAMSLFALHLPERRGLFRWTWAGATILLTHGAIVATVALWYARRPVEPKIPPAIMVTLAPVDSSSPVIQNQDIAVGPTMQQAEAAPKEPPKNEEKPVEQVVQPPSPPQQTEIT